MDDEYRLTVVKMSMSCRYLVSFVLLCAGPLSRAQELSVRVIDVHERPLKKQSVGVSLLYDRGEKTPAKYDAKLSLKTAADGVVRFTLPEPPPAQLAVSVTCNWARWHCAPGVVAKTQDVIRKGIVMSAASATVSAPATLAKPGEILFVNRPGSFLQWLLYPLEKD